MGYALAEAAHLAGAKVILISGPTALAAPAGVDTYYVDSALAMHEAVMNHLQPGMIFIGTAAVADYRVQEIVLEKIKKEANPEIRLHLNLNPDILAMVAASGKASFVVGFAAETNNLLKHAKAKLKNKKLDMVVANQVGPGLGFDCDCNKVTVLTKDTQIELDLTHKIRLAGQIIAILAAILQNVAHQKTEE